MAIKYKYVEYKTNLTEENESNRVRPIVVPYGTARTNDLIERMVHRNHFGRADAARAIEAVFDTIETLLHEGKVVNIEHYGSFIPTIQFARDKVSNRIPERKEKSTKLRAETIEIKSIIFRATPLMKVRIGNDNFVREMGDKVEKGGQFV